MGNWAENLLNSLFQRGRAPRGRSGSMLLASTLKDEQSVNQRDSLHSRLVPNSTGRLPGEGTFYDPIGVGNFVDLEKSKFTASLKKSFQTNVLSNFLDADLPAKITVGGKLGTLWVDGVKVDPVGKLGVSIRLLDLGTSDTRQTGFLRYRAATRTNGKADHGFEIDRRVSIFNLPSTTLYGNVAYRTNNHANGVWETVSSFGVHQEFRLGGIKFAGRVGMTPDGKCVSDLRL